MVQGDAAVRIAILKEIKNELFPDSEPGRSSVSSGNQQM
jgi:hypothetical protein